MNQPGRHRLLQMGIAVGILLAAAVLACTAAGVFSPRRENPPGSQPEETAGIHFVRDDELYGRMVRVMARREAAVPDGTEPKDVHLQKLYDGALLCFAEAAVEVWPEMDTEPLTRSLLFEDEAEKAGYIALARELIGDVQIDKPEDITYWINKETLWELLSEDRR